HIAIGWIRVPINKSDREIAGLWRKYFYCKHISFWMNKFRNIETKTPEGAECFICRCNLFSIHKNVCAEINAIENELYRASRVIQIESSSIPPGSLKRLMRNRIHVFPVVEITVNAVLLQSGQNSCRNRNRIPAFRIECWCRYFFASSSYFCGRLNHP